MTNREKLNEITDELRAVIKQVARLERDRADLLAACKAAMYAMETAVSMFPNGNRVLTSATEQAASAIAKAEGSECSSCGGKGYIVDFGIDPYEATCKACQGSGVKLAKAEGGGE